MPCRLYPRSDNIPDPQPRRPGGGWEAEDHAGLGEGEPGGGGGETGGEGEDQLEAEMCE